MPGNFSKLIVENQWEYLTYVHDGVQLDEKRGGRCTVRWADGTTSKHFFTSIPQNVNYSDHGIERTCTQHVLVLELALQGRAGIVDVTLALYDIADVVQS